VNVYAASYEGRSLDEFLTDLRERGVQLVADVREAPISRKPGFSKTSLATALESAGISYCHIRALGCPKPVRDAYRQDGDWARYTSAFLEHLDRQQPAIHELVALSQKTPTALLCYEADFNRCHRTYVARAVAEMSGATVCHITSSGLVNDVSGRG
jgi:uncharacterized protein (DUF488 family)